MTETEFCAHCVHNLDRPEHELLVITLQQMLHDYQISGSTIPDIQSRLCRNAGCLVE